jgi:hypothetical protein
MVVEMLLNGDIKKKTVQFILHFQKEITVIMYIIEFESFHLDKISIKYEISKFMFFYCLKWSIW